MSYLSMKESRITTVGDNNVNFELRLGNPSASSAFPTVDASIILAANYDTTKYGLQFDAYDSDNNSAKVNYIYNDGTETNTINIIQISSIGTLNQTVINSDYISATKSITAGTLFVNNVITSNLTVNGDINAGSIVRASGVNYGNYLYWNGTTWVNGDATLIMGQNAGLSNQFAGSIAIGVSAGQVNQGANGAPSLAIGTWAGQSNQSGYGFAIGTYAGRISQGAGGMAMGSYAAYSDQGVNSLAVGSSAGQNNQGVFATAVGYAAGQVGQGNYSVAIGVGAGSGHNEGWWGDAASQAANSIAINAQTFNYPYSQINPQTEGFFVNPIRAVENTYALMYNTETSEITYAIPASDIRLKKDVVNTSLGLNFINQLRPIEFKWKDRNKMALNYDGTPIEAESPGVRVHQGLIAQEVKAVLDGMGIDSAIFINVNNVPSGIRRGKTFDEHQNLTVDTEVDLTNGPNGIQGVRYEELITPSIKAIQELYSAVNNQSTQIAMLASAITRLQQSQ